MNFSEYKRSQIREIDGAGSGVDTDLVRGGDPVKVDSDGTAIVKTDDSFVKNQCTAWVNFDGTDGTIRDSYNVSSVTRNDTGKYTIDFANEMDNTDFVDVGSGGDQAGEYLSGSSDDRTTSSFTCCNYVDGDGYKDATFMSVLIFGGK